MNINCANRQGYDPCGQMLVLLIFEKKIFTGLPFLEKMTACVIHIVERTPTKVAGTQYFLTLAQLIISNSISYEKKAKYH